MSLGWLTESSLIPKEPKPITGVGTASLLSLQAAVYEREQRGPLASIKRRRAEAENAKNEGVEARMAKDTQQRAGDQATPEIVTAKLREKALKYEAMMNGRLKGSEGEPLVDFSKKRAEGLLDQVMDEMVLEDLESMLKQEDEETVLASRMAAGSRVAIAPPESLGGPGSGVFSSTTGPSPLSASMGLAPGISCTKETQAAKRARGSLAAVRQAFERPLSSHEELEMRERQSAETELCRGTIGLERKQAREAIRGRLAALRAAMSGEGLEGE